MSACDPAVPVWSGRTDLVGDRRLVVWAFVGIIAASEAQAAYGLVICGWLRINGSPDACPEILSAIHTNRESLIAGVLGLLAGFAGATSRDP